MDERLVEAAQALLTGYDTALSREWRAEDRQWRGEDLKWREAERTQMLAERDFMWARLGWAGWGRQGREKGGIAVMWNLSV
jgi:calcium release-activated calcium channel protein 1